MKTKKKKKYIYDGIRYVKTKEGFYLHFGDIIKLTRRRISISMLQEYLGQWQIRVVNPER